MFYSRFVLTSFNVVDSSPKCVYRDENSRLYTKMEDDESMCSLLTFFAFSCLTKLFPQQVTGWRAPDDDEMGEKKIVF